MATKSQLIQAIGQQVELPSEQVLDAKTVTTLVTSFAESLTVARNSGSALAGFCAAAHGAGLAINPPKSIVNQLVEAIAEKMGWTGTARERANKAEARTIITAHALLPEAVTAYRTATGACGYHDAVKLARSVNELGNVEAAVKHATTKSESKKDPQATFARALQAYFKFWQNKQPKKDDAKAARLAAMDKIKAFAASMEVKLKTE